jgi:hypothetical protein
MATASPKKRHAGPSLHRHPYARVYNSGPVGNITCGAACPYNSAMAVALVAHALDGEIAVHDPSN